MIASENGKVKIIVWAALFLWLVLTFVLGAGGAFVQQPGAPPLPLLAGVLTPIVVFLVAFRFAGSFRDFVMSLDLELAAGIQAWRFTGLGFLALYAYGILPGLFALSTGLGDMAIGVTAPWVVRALRDRKDFAASPIFRVWNLLGILDLVSAVSTGALSAFLGIGISEEISTFPMAHLPLVIIPVFLVPLFVMLHLASLFQAGCLSAAGETSGWTCSPSGRGPVETPV